MLSFFTKLFVWVISGGGQTSLSRIVVFCWFCLETMDDSLFGIEIHLVIEALHNEQLFVSKLIASGLGGQHQALATRNKIIPLNRKLPENVAM